MSYKCTKGDCQKHGQECGSRSALRCQHCEIGRTDQSHFIVPVAAAYESSYSSNSSSSSSSDSGSSWSSGSSSNDSGSSWSGGGGDSGGGGASGSFD